jgi:hypothetical protein
MIFLRTKKAKNFNHASKMEQNFVKFLRWRNGITDIRKNDTGKIYHAIFRFILPVCNCVFLYICAVFCFYNYSGEEIFIIAKIPEALPAQGWYQSILQSFIGFLFPLFPYHAHPGIADLVQSAASGKRACSF